MNADPLEWLVPDAPPPERAELRRLVQALRVLHADLARPGARSVEPSWHRARGELEDVARREALRALETLLVAHLAALLPGDAFLPLPLAPLALDEAWRVLVVRERLAPPPPGEPLARSARALVTRGLALGAGAAWGRAWRAALEHAEHGPVPRRWQRELAWARAQRTRPRLLARFVLGLAASELERGAPARAFDVLEAHAPLARLEPALARLSGWCADLLGRPATGARAAATPLPLGLAELAAEDARFAARFPGVAASNPPRARAVREARAELGASVLAAFERDSAGRVRVLHREGVAGPAPAPLAPPSAPLERAWRRGDDPPWPQALGGSRTRALARLRLPGGGAAGERWLQLEWPHALVPCRARLTALARAFVLAERRPASVAVRREPGDPRAPVLAHAQRRLRALGVARAAAFEPGTPARALFVQGLNERAERLAREGEPFARALGLASFTLVRAARPLARVHAAGPLETLAAALEPLAADFLCASFRAHERALGRGDPWLLPAHLELAGEARPRGPWWLSGPDGSGRHTRARALLYAAGLDPDEPGRIVTSPGARAPVEGEVWIAAADAPVPQGVVALRLAPLATRRVELAALLAHLARTHVPPLALADEALAELWRRDWEGFGVLAEVFEALARHGPRIVAADVRRVLVELGRAPVSRRAPEGLDLDLALRETRHRSGQENRARAARWLGLGPLALQRVLAGRGAREGERRQPCPWLAPPGSIPSG